ncbi:MAG: hypothetical protein WC356_00655 [Candidatus Micrarchaeia archaeon]|jgi:hypothetical protein
MQNCTSSNVTQANIIAILSSNETTMQINGFLYYENETRSKIGIENAQLFVRYSCKDGTKKIYNIYSNGDGEFLFNLNQIRNNCSNCTTITFYYCPGEKDNYEILTQCLGETIDASNFPETYTGFDDSYIIEEYVNYTTATQPVRFCIPSMTGASDFLCVGILIIFGILGASLFIAGRNPLSFFNFGGPRPPRGRQYRMKPKSVSLTMLAPAGIAGRLVGFGIGKLAKKAEAKSESKAQKRAEAKAQTKAMTEKSKGQENKGIASTGSGDKAKLTRFTEGTVKTAGFIRTVKLTIQGVPNKIAVSIFGETASDILFGAGTSQSAKMAAQVMAGLTGKEGGVGLSQQMIAGPPIDYSTSLWQDIKSGLSYLGDYFLQTMLNRYSGGFLTFGAINKIKAKYIYGPGKWLLGISGIAKVLNLNILTKKEREFIKEYNGEIITKDNLSYSPNGKYVIIKTTEGKEFKLRTKTLTQVGYALRIQGSGLEENARQGYFVGVDSLINNLISGALVQNISNNTEAINSEFKKMENKIKSLEKEKEKADLKKQKIIEKDIAAIKRNKEGLLSYYAENTLGKGFDLNKEQKNTIITGFEKDGSIKNAIDGLLNKINQGSIELLGMFALTRLLMHNAYSVGKENIIYNEWEEKYKKQKEKEEKERTELETRKSEIENKKAFITFGIGGLSLEEQIEYLKIEKRLIELNNTFKTEEKELIDKINKLSGRLNEINNEKIQEKIMDLTAKLNALKSVYQEEYKELKQTITEYSVLSITSIGNTTVIHSQFTQKGMYEEASKLSDLFEKTQKENDKWLLEGVINFGSLKTDLDIQGMKNTLEYTQSKISLYNNAINPLYRIINEEVAQILKEDKQFKNEFNMFINNIEKELNEFNETTYGEYKQKQDEIYISSIKMMSIEMQKEEINEQILALAENIPIPKENEMPFKESEQKEIYQQIDDLKTDYIKLEKQETELKKQIEKQETEANLYYSNFSVEGYNISFYVMDKYIEEKEKPDLKLDVDKNMPIATTQYEIYTDFKNMKKEFDQKYDNYKTAEEKEKVFNEISTDYEISNLYIDLFRANREFIEEYTNWTDKQKEKREYIVDSWQNLNNEIRDIPNIKENKEYFPNTFRESIEQAKNTIYSFGEAQAEEFNKIDQKTFRNLITGDIIGSIGSNIFDRTYGGLTQEIGKLGKNIGKAFTKKDWENEEGIKQFNNNIENYIEARENTKEIIKNFDKNEDETVKMKVDKYLANYLKNSETTDISILEQYIKDPSNKTNIENVDFVLNSKELKEKIEKQLETHTIESHRQDAYGNSDQVETNSYKATKYKKYAKQIDKLYKRVTETKDEKERAKARKEYEELVEKINNS